MIAIYVWLCFIILFLIGVNFLMKNEKFDKIPGPAGIFLLENSLDFLMDSAKTFRYFTMLCNKYKKLFRVKLGNKKIIILHNPEDVEALISGTKYNKKGYLYGFIQPWLQDGLLLSDGEKWHTRRKVLTPAFHFNILNNFHTMLVENSGKLVERIDIETKKSQTDIMDIVTDFTLKSICETAMGTKLDEETSEFGKTYKNAIHELGSIVCYRAQRVWMYPNCLFRFSNLGKRQNTILNMITTFRNKVVQKRRDDFVDVKEIIDKNGKDQNVYGKQRLALLDLLLQAERNGSIDINGINEEVDTFMFEGHDTTATALQFTFMILAQYQQIQDKIVEECNKILTPDQMPTINDLAQLKYLECCIKESLRMFPPVYFISRQIEKPIKLATFECPAGTDVNILIRELHHDCQQFKDPFEFIPERFMQEPTWHQYAYIPFSAGPRNCIGQKFAMMEMKLALSMVLRQFRVLPITKPDDLMYLADFILRPKDPIYVKFEKRA